MPYRRVARLQKGRRKRSISDLERVDSHTVCGTNWFGSCFLPPGQSSRAVELTAPHEIVQLQRRRDLERTGGVEQSLRRVLEFLDGDG